MCLLLAPDRIELLLMLLFLIAILVYKNGELNDLVITLNHLTLKIEQHFNLKKRNTMKDWKEQKASYMKGKLNQF